jgi:hypothetical protein
MRKQKLSRVDKEKALQEQKFKKKLEIVHVVLDLVGPTIKIIKGLADLFS